jgi:hypothetical protein
VVAGRPYNPTFFSLAQIKSPYTFDEWTEKGKKIPSAEQILIHLCKEYPGIVSYEEILEGLYYVCTHLSVSSMLEIVQGDDYDLDQQLIAAGYWEKLEIRLQSNLLLIWRPQSQSTVKLRNPPIHLKLMSSALSQALVIQESLLILMLKFKAILGRIPH